MKKIMLLLVFITLILLGILFGNLTSGIFLKAVTVCLECIGIG